MDKAEFGLWCEKKAAEYLQTKGWRLLEERVRFREGEIDLIMEHEGVLKFVEVKGRRSLDFGHVVESVTAQKILRMKRAVWKWRELRADFRKGEFCFLGVLQRGAHLEFFEHLLLEL